MSLTSHLDDKSSPIRHFLYENFPNTQPFLKESRQVIRTSTTLRPSGPVPYSTIGTALDYRLRYYFEVTPKEELVAWLGCLISTGRTTLVADNPPINTELADEFFASLQDVLDTLQPKHRMLNRPDEERLAKYCFVLALFEQVFRAGLGIRSPLFEQKFTNFQELLKLATMTSVNDMCELSFLFYEQFKGAFQSSVVLNPAFAGSRDVGGADADFILDGNLVDIKATVNPKIDSIWIYQLLGYVLLDYNDEYGITSIGLYMARQGLSFEWSLQDVLNILGNDSTLSLTEIRGQFEEVAKNLK